MKIEKNIPIPVHGRNNGVYSFIFEMESGDSVFFEGLSTDSNFSRHAHRAAKNKGVKILTRNVEGGFRLWRVE